MANQSKAQNQSSFIGQSKEIMSNQERTIPGVLSGFGGTTTNYSPTQLGATNLQNKAQQATNIFSSVTSPRNQIQSIEEPRVLSQTGQNQSTLPVVQQDTPIVPAAGVAGGQTQAPTPQVGEKPTEEVKPPEQQAKAIAESSPTVSESTAKENADGSTTTTTKDYETQEAQDYKKQLDDAMQSIDSEIEYARSRFTQIAKGADEAQANLIKAIEKTFEVRKYEMERINKSALNTQTLLGSRSGRQRYAPEMQSSILSEEERAGLVRLTEIEALEFQTIAVAQQAATEEDLAILNQQMTTLGDLRAEKQQIMTNIYNTAVLEETRAQTRAKFAIDMQMYVQELVEYQTKNAVSYADSAAIGLFTFDGNFNVIPPTEQDIKRAANEFGISESMLKSSVFEKIKEVQAMNADEYGTYFERQQFRAELEQKDFQNRLDQQKFALEREMFGFKVSEAGFAVVDGQLVRVDTGATGTARDWANQIAKGKLKMSDVPNDLKSAVVSELETLPPKPEDISEVRGKINELDEILTSPGITKAVGVNWLARLQFNPLDWNDKAQKNAFIGKVERLLSEKTLQSLIDAKADGATFGALSEGELQILRASASAIGSWARDVDGDGVTDFYEVDEKTFKQEIGRIKGDYEELARKAEETIPFTPFTGYQDFYKRATDAQKELYFEFDNDPSFQNASVEELIQAVNEAEGFTGEKGGALLSSVVKQKYPTGTKGGQCGTFAHKIVDFPPVGDMKEEKFRSVDKYGFKKDEWSPRPGDVVITNEHPTYGHVAILGERVSPTKYKLIESNYGNNELVTHDRIIDINSPKIYGAIRGTYKV